MRAKDIRVKPIAARDAAKIIKRIHYSGKVVQNSKLHFGVFLDGECGGAMSFGTPMDKRRSLNLVSGTSWSGMMELNRMAFADWLPRNSESRALGYVMRTLRKHYPQLEWILSFADATQCGDGTIYRASGFQLTGIKKNTTLLQMPNGEIVADKTLNDRVDARGRRGTSAARDAGAKPLAGFQLRYVYFLNAEAKSRLTVPVIPFDEIEARGASMYRGRTKPSSEAAGFQPDEDGAIPIRALQSPADP